MFESPYIIEKIAALQREEIRCGIDRQRISQRTRRAAKTKFSGKGTRRMRVREMALTIVFLLLILPGLIIYVGKRIVDDRAESELEVLKSMSVDISSNTYSSEQIYDLPIPVQRFFLNVLEEGQPYISVVSLKHDGQFKTALDKDWINIEGEQLLIAEEPGFLWRGKTTFFTVRDKYSAGKGRMVVSLLNLFKVVDMQGDEIDQGELLRWLGESVWFPTNLLPSPRLQWTPLDDNTAKLSFNYLGKTLNYKVSFNAKGEITQLETRRYMGNEGLKTWIGRVSEYREIDGMKIPMKIEALWSLADGEHSYARFHVKSIHHN